MALVKGICKNFGECDLADNKEIQEVDKTNFVCEECGKPLHSSLSSLLLWSFWVELALASILFLATVKPKSP